MGDSYKVTTVKIDDSTYALVGSYADDGFTILDITTPESPTLVFNATENTRINADLNGPTGISTIQIENSIYAVITSLAKCLAVEWQCRMCNVYDLHCTLASRCH